MTSTLVPMNSAAISACLSVVPNESGGRCFFEQREWNIDDGRNTAEADRRVVNHFKFRPREAGSAIVEMIRQGSRLLNLKVLAYPR